MAVILHMVLVTVFKEYINFKHDDSYIYSALEMRPTDFDSKNYVLPQGKLPILS